MNSRVIHNPQGTRSLEGGVSVDEGLYDRLLANRLATPLDEHVTGPAITGADLVAAAEDAMARWPFFALLGPPGRVRSMMLEAIKAIPLPRAIAVHLGLARDTRPAVFEHGILAALLCAHLVREGGAPILDMTMAAAAGLVHDLGMLHIDADVLESGNRLNGDDRRPLYVHPVTSSMLIARFHELPNSVARAVLEHHELMDGSGYPRGLTGTAMSPWGRMLSLVEVVTAMFDGERRFPEQRVSLLLRMAPRRFDPTLVPSINRLLAALPRPADDLGADSVDSVDRLRLHSELLQQWRSVVEQLVPSVEAESVALLAAVSEQTDSLQRMLYDAGITPDQLDLVEQDSERDPGLRIELWTLAQELQWQLRATANQLTRRWRALGVNGAARPLPKALGGWLANVAALDLPG